MPIAVPWSAAIRVAIAVLWLLPLRAQAPFQEWSDAAFPAAKVRSVQEREMYPAGRPEVARLLDATVVFDRRSSWSRGRALRHIRKTAAILQPCGIGLGRVVLARVDLGSDFRGIDVATTSPETGVPAAVTRLSAMLPTHTPRPVGFLIGSVRGTASLAVAYGFPQAGSERPPHADTAWISYRSHWLQRRDEDYSPLAHEFAHLLCRCGHSGGASRHLLHRARNFLGSKVLPEHCASFRESPLLRDNRR